MEIHPQAQEFSEIYERTEEAIAREAELMKKMADEGAIIAQGPKEALQKLQDDLRKRGYRQVR